MKLFECSNGVLINPLLVASCRAISKQVIFMYPGDVRDIVVLANDDEAEAELKAYKAHYEASFT